MDTHRSLQEAIAVVVAAVVGAVVLAAVVGAVVAAVVVVTAGIPKLKPGFEYITTTNATTANKTKSKRELFLFIVIN